MSEKLGTSVFLVQRIEDLPTQLTQRFQFSVIKGEQGLQRVASTKEDSEGSRGGIESCCNNAS